MHCAICVKYLKVQFTSKQHEHMYVCQHYITEQSNSPVGGGGGEATGSSTVGGGCGIVSAAKATGVSSSAGGEGAVISTGGAETG